jgi:hypothetical protein
MQVQLDIEFDQLVKLAKRLPVSQWTKLKQQVDKKVKTSRKVSVLESFLMTAPTYTKKQLNEIDKTRKAINQWRTK